MGYNIRINFMPMIVAENLKLIIASGLAILFLVLIFWTWSLQRRLKNLVSGKRINLEDTLLESYKRLKELENFRKKTQNDLSVIENKLRKSVRSIKTMRFNPFKGSGEGGNQSFSSAFLNEDGDGVILTALYHRERISVFAKPLNKNESEFELTEEEQKVANQALEAIKTGN